ncbi:MAG: hypothetical protein JWP48_1092 [Actinoallomurus sp.]|jgi:hypothetical protein|nr:hypothetical protein [Actinoallomurus sp.]
MAPLPEWRLLKAADETAAATRGDTASRLRYEAERLNP